VSGPLALVGGGEFTDGCSFDAALLAASGGAEVAVLPTAAAYEHPDRAVDTAAAWFDGLGAKVRSVRALTRSDALLDEHVAAVREARFLYVPGGSPMHLRSVLKESPLWDAIVAAWHDGAVLAGSSAGAMVLCDPMVDPRGGAFTLGLGLVAQVAIIPHHDHWSEEKAKRTLELAPKGLPIVGIDERTALIRDPDGTWRTDGAGEVVVFVDGERADLGALPA
jgi:cyanophycinase